MNLVNHQQRPSNAPPDKRNWPRVKIAVQTELRLAGSPSIRATTSDLSVGGCYVEMMFTLEVGREMEITLWLGQAKVVTKAKVVTCHPQFGNGIQFLKMSQEDQDLLWTFLDAEVRDARPF